MNSKQFYCIQLMCYSRVLNENAPTANRGIFGGARVHLNEMNDLIVTTLEKISNTFVGFYV